MKLGLMALLGGALLGLLAAGCGGSGAKELQRASKEDILAALQRGAEKSATVAGDTSTPMTAKKPNRKFRTSSSRQEGEVWYSDELQLWIEQIEGMADDYESPSGYKFWADEARTIDGGHDLIWVSDPNTIPIVLRYELIYKEGTRKGEYDKLRIEFDGEEVGGGRSTGEAFWPAEGKLEYTGEWDEAGYGVWNGKWTSLDESWENLKIERISFDTGPKVTITSSLNVTYSLNYAFDGSGEGTITGTADGLPATVSWDTEGAGIVTWSDGTTSEIYIEPMY